MIPIISQERSTPNPPLTTADGEETILEVPLEFLSFILVRSMRISAPTGVARGSFFKP